MTYEAEAENITSENVIAEILKRSLSLINLKQKTTELLKKVRKIEIKTRGLSNQIFSGGIPHGL